MRVGFLGDPVVTQRGGATYYEPPLALLSEVAYAWAGAPPGVGGLLYAGVVDLDAAEVQLLLDRGTAAGVRLALVLNVDGAEGTRTFSLQEQTRIGDWMVEKGLPRPRDFEAQIDFVQRIMRLLSARMGMDQTLSAVQRELAVRPR
jgi:hypothetical protein